MTSKKTPKDNKKAPVLLKLEAYQRFFDDPDGKTILYDLMEYGYFIKPPYDPDPQKTLLNLGRQELILYIIEQCNRDTADIYSFIEQQEEARKGAKDEY